jgi:hypothetical protein
MPVRFWVVPGDLGDLVTVQDQDPVMDPDQVLVQDQDPVTDPVTDPDQVLDLAGAVAAEVGASPFHSPPSLV